LPLIWVPVLFSAAISDETRWYALEAEAAQITRITAQKTSNAPIPYTTAMNFFINASPFCTKKTSKNFQKLQFFRSLAAQHCIMFAYPVCVAVLRLICLIIACFSLNGAKLQVLFTSPTLTGSKSIFNNNAQLHKKTGLPHFNNKTNN
jgi:hypothetical protein